MTKEKLNKGLKLQTGLNSLNGLYDTIEARTGLVDEALIKKLLNLVQEEINKFETKFKEL